MKKSFILVILVSLVGVPGLQAQCTFDRLVNKIKFTGAAPSPWAINGQVNDWTTILGPATGNNAFPYSPPFSSSFNYSKDPSSALLTDLDAPEPAVDIRLMAFTHDDYNVYFYLRRLANANPPNSFYYFCDINADGFMNAGEPVFGGRFNGNNFLEMTVYRFVPNLLQDYVAGKGNMMVNPDPATNKNLKVDGYTMKGSVVKMFTSNAIPSPYGLGAHEVFDGAVTENGYGVEMAIPWKYFRNWQTLSAPILPGYIFTYHVAMQRGAPPGYNPQSVADNAGSCCQKLLISGNALFNVTNQSITTVVPGLSYQLQVTLQNSTNIPEELRLSKVKFSNIQLNDGIPFSPEAFSVSVNGLGYVYEPVPPVPVIYGGPDFITVPVLVGPFASTTFTVNISLPANGSVASLSMALDFGDARFTIEALYCAMNVGGGGGGHPVVFDVTTDGINRRLILTETSSLIKMLRVYPNPSKGTVTVLIPGENKQGQLLLEDISGKRVYRQLNITGANVTLQDLKPGFYLVRFIPADGSKQCVEKLVVQ